VTRALKRFLPSREKLNPVLITHSVQAFQSCTQPQHLLEFFNSQLAGHSPSPQAASVPATSINAQHVTSLLKVLATNNKGVSRHLSPLLNKNVVLEGLEWYTYVTASESDKSNGQPDLILAQSALNACNSIEARIAAKNEAYLNFALNILDRITGKGQHGVISATVLCMLYQPVILLAGKSAKMETAQRLFNELTHLIGNNTQASTALMNACNYNGEFDKAISIYVELVHSENSKKNKNVENLAGKVKTANPESWLPCPADDDVPSHPQKNTLTRWPSERTMFALLKACVASDSIISAEAYIDVFKIFEKWDEARPRPRGSPALHLCNACNYFYRVGVGIVQAPGRIGQCPRPSLKSARSGAHQRSPRNSASGVQQ
jgi:hypothetical protein